MPAMPRSQVRPPSRDVSQKQKQKRASDATSSTVAESDVDISPLPFTRKSLADRARTFDPSYSESPVKAPPLFPRTQRRGSTGHSNMQELLNASKHRKKVNVIDGRRATYRDKVDPGDLIIVAPAPKPGMRKMLDESDHRKLENVTDGRRRTYHPNNHRPRSDGSYALIPAENGVKPNHFKVGASMQALLDASRHRKMRQVNSGHRRLTNMRRVKPALPENTTPLPPTQTTFRNVRAPMLTVDPKTFERPRHPKTKFQMNLILQAISTQTFVLKHHSAETSKQLAEAMEPVEMKRGQVLHQQGNSSGEEDHLFVVQSGSLDVEIDGALVENVSAGSCIGQERLLLRSENKATVTASSSSQEPTTLFRLNQMTFRAIMQQQHQYVLQELKTTSERQESAAALSTKNVSAQSKETKKREKKKSRVEEPAFSFEDSPIFRRQQAIRASTQKHAATKDDLEMIRVLGEGQFGEVWLVAATLPDLPTPDEPRQEFALKIQQMNDAMREDAEDAIRREINALQQLHHPFIVNLVHTYESEESIDMLLGLIPGGELWEEIHQEDDEGNWTSGIPESRSRFYSYVLTDTIAFLHSREFVFRDLKPENIMIDEDGYPILVDFGFAKQVPHGDRTWTFCGTPNYVAPEIISNVGHGPAVDYWALGIVIYEMISGENPFFYDGMEQCDLYQAILDEDPYAIADEKGASPDALDLIDHFLKKDPSERLGTKGVQGVMNHAWFKGMPSMADIRSKTVNPDNISELVPGDEESIANTDDTDSFADLEVEDDVSLAADEPPQEVEIVTPKSKKMSISGSEKRSKSIQEKHTIRKELNRRLSADDVVSLDDEGLEAGEFAEEVAQPTTPAKVYDPNSPTSVKYWSPRKNRKGYYVLMKSPEEKRSSQTRRGVVNDFLAQYLEDVDLDDNLGMEQESMGGRLHASYPML